MNPAKAQAIVGVLGDKTVVRVVYSDESEAGAEPEGPLTVVAAIMLNMDSQWRPVRDAVEYALVETYGFTLEQLSRWAIKGKALYHQAEHEEVKAKTLLALLMAIPRQHLIPIFYGAVDNIGLEEVYKPIRRGAPSTFRGTDPFRVALEAVMTRVDTYVHTGFTEEQVLWIHDTGSLNKSAKSILRGFRDIRRMQEEEFQSEMAGEFSGEMAAITIPDNTHIADMIYFGDDKESRLLQLVDVCCSTITQYLLGNPIAAPYYKALKPYVVNDGTPPLYQDARVKRED